MKTLNYFILMVSIISLFACSTRKIERVSPDETIDLSGRWNDTDSKMVAEAMVDQVLSGAWIDNYMKAHNSQKPVVVVGIIYNKSHEHIDSNTFIKDIERAFINSGRVRLIQAADKREELRKERASQQELASLETAKKWGQELGADFMLNGDISSIVDTYKNERVYYYQTNLELSDIETAEIVWIGDKKIKKYINK